VYAGEPLNCTASASGTVTSWSWSAPGGSPSSAAGNPFSATFASAGTVTVTVTACNGSACSSLGQAVNVLPLFQVYVYPDTASVYGGEYVSVNLWARVAGASLGLYDIDIWYDGTLITATDCSSGSGGTCDPYFDVDTVNFAGYAGQSGDVYLGTVEFWADYVTGTAYVNVTPYDLTDGQGNDILDEAYSYGGTITVY
jgi:hypothetical protein